MNNLFFEMLPLVVTTAAISPYPYHPLLSQQDTSSFTTVLVFLFPPAEQPLASFV